MSKNNVKGPAIVAITSSLAVLGVLSAYVLQNPGQAKGDAAQQAKPEAVRPAPEAGREEGIDSRAASALNGILDGMPNIPAGADVASVKVNGGLAMVDFTPEIQKGYGSSEESELINGLLKGLAEFDQIQRAQFSVQGQPLESLGHLELLEPVDVRQGV